MSRIGKQEIHIPEKTTVTLDESTGLFTVNGPKGTLTRTFKKDIAIMINGNIITTKPVVENPQTLALWGTYSSHIDNMITGVNTPFEKTLEVEGVGMRWEMQGKDIKMLLGFSHPVIVKVPEGLTVTIEKNVMKVNGIDKEQVGQFAANIRSTKKPEPYKGKGIHYLGEVILRKQGKKSV
ncbi:MAG: 50S ribosomal protein L6 [Candidatus Paceibacterota bacterium]